MDSSHQVNRTDIPRGALQAMRDGRPGARDHIANFLQSPLQRDVARFLGEADPDVDDIVQETIVATLDYLARDAEFSGDPVSLAMTIARNRCRDVSRWRQRRPRVDVTSLGDWLAAPDASALDELEAAERIRLLQRCLDRLGLECRKLLRALFIEERSTESVRRELGLGTVQGVYYRKSLCLQKMRTLFNDAVAGRSNPEAG